LVSGLGLGLSTGLADDHHHRNQGGIPSPLAARITGSTNGSTSQAKFELPPLPSGVMELKFSDFFVKPVGARGLELTEKLRECDGRRVRMLGYMVQQEEPPPGMFLFSPLPAQQVHEHDNGLADDLPPCTVRVLVPTCHDQVVPFAPGLMLLTGTLSVGNRAEADDRISIARLALDPPHLAAEFTPAGKRISMPTGKGAERLMSNTSRE
jgi:hypothetical protein